MGGKEQSFTKLAEHMRHIILKKRANFYGDRAISGGVTV